MAETNDPIPEIARAIRFALINAGPDIDKVWFISSMLTLLGHVYVDQLKLGHVDDFKAYVKVVLDQPDLWKEGK